MTCDIDKHFLLGKEETEILLTLMEQRIDRLIENPYSEHPINSLDTFINNLDYMLMECSLLKDLREHKEILEG